MIDTLDALFEELQAEADNRRLPPVHLWQPERVGSIDICIRKDGSWWHEGAPIRRDKLVALFSTVLKREGEHYYLVTPAEKLSITVEDAPLVALDFVARGEGDAQELLFTTNGGDNVIANAQHPIWIAEQRPYLHVRDGLNALIARSAYYRLVEYAVAAEDRFEITSGGAVLPSPHKPDYMLG